MHHCRVCNYLCDCDGYDQRTEQPDDCIHLGEDHPALPPDPTEEAEK